MNHSMVRMIYSVLLRNLVWRDHAQEKLLLLLPREPPFLRERYPPIDLSIAPSCFALSVICSMGEEFPDTPLP